MYDIAIFSATLAAADRLKPVMSLEAFLSMFKEEQHDSIMDVLLDMGYIESYWTGIISWRWI